MKHFSKIKLLVLLTMTGFLMSGCVFFSPDMFGGGYTAPLEDYVVEGTGDEKVLVIPISGMISSLEEDELVRKKPSMIKELVSQIQKAQADDDVRAIVLKINSRGGTATGSEILYNELKKLQTSRQVPIVTVMMDVAASGGYYVSLPSDHIIAHQTTLTGSIGVIFIRPKLHGLMDKIGVSVETSKSGEDKDMGSPFKPSTGREEDYFQSITDEMASLFKTRLLENRDFSAFAIDEIMTARIFTANQALELGLIDQIGYVDDAVAKAKELAGLDPSASVIMYRRVEFEDDNIYNNITTSSMSSSSPIDLGPLTKITELKSGMYYLWDGISQ